MFPNKAEALQYLSDIRFFFFEHESYSNEERMAGFSTHLCSLAINKLELGNHLAQIIQELASEELKKFSVADILGAYY